MVARGLILVLVALAAACKERPRPCAPATPSIVEVRDGAGQLLLAVKGKELCSGPFAQVGRIDEAAGLPVLVDADGKRRLAFRKEPNGDLEADGPAGLRLRIHRQGTETRVLDREGVPFGSLTAEEGRAVVRDRASSPIALASPRDADQVVADLQQKTLYYLVPSAQPVAAGALALPDLSLEERLAVALALSTPAK